LRIIIIAQLFPPDMGGGATRAYNVAKGLVANGCEVTIVCAFPHYPSGNIPAEYKWKAVVRENVDGLSIIRTPVPPIASQGFAKRIILFLAFALTSLFALPMTGRADCIWSANPNLISIFPGKVYSLLKRSPIALNVDDLWPEDMGLRENGLPYKFVRLLARVAYATAKIITPVSPGYVEIMKRSYGVQGEKIRVIRGGVDMSKFGKTNDDAPPSEFTVSYSGAFSKAYDFEQVLLAAKQLEAKSSEIHFLIQGKGELAESIRSTIVRLRLHNVTLVDKVFTRDEVASLLKRSSVLILPLIDFGHPYRGISSKLYEYQAAGKPILCCADGLPSTHVRETKSGIVVKPGDFESLATAILFLKQHPDVANQLGENGKKFVEEAFTIEKVGLEMKMALQEIRQKNYVHGESPAIGLELLCCLCRP
jgi:colanic acid biosynthesis glycosyl transferase WcaI